MPTIYLDLVNFSKDFQLERVTVDRIVCNGPCLVAGLVIASDGGGDADADVYDGHGTGGDKKLDLYCADEETRPYSFMPPAYFAKGLYVDIGTNCESVVVHYMALAE